MQMTPFGPAQPAPIGAEGLAERFLAGSIPTTCEAYRGDVQDFAAWMRAEPAAAIAQLLASRPGEANRLALDYSNHLRD